MAQRSLLFYTHALVGGGAERVWARLASGFAARGDKVTFVVDFHAEENLRFLSNDVRLIILPRRHPLATEGLAHLLKSTAPDVVLSAISISNLKLTFASWWAGCARRAILSYHGFYENEPQFLSRLGYQFSRHMVASTGATIAVSDSLRGDMIARFKVDPQKLTTIYNPAAIDPFPAPVTAAELAARPPHVVAIGRMVPDKDFSFMVRSFARTKTPDAQLTIFGEGPERQNVRALSHQLGIADRVHLPGFSREVYQTLAAAKCFALASMHETFSLALVEAMSFGLPAVVTRSGGPPEVLGSPDLGRIIEIGDIDGYASALDEQLANPGDPAPRQARARQFSLEAALDHYDTLIDRVIARAAG